MLSNKSPNFQRVIQENGNPVGYFITITDLASYSLEDTKFLSPKRCDARSRSRYAAYYGQQLATVLDGLHSVKLNANFLLHPSRARGAVRLSDADGSLLVCPEICHRQT